MKIISLLPSATEIVFALGLGDSLEGVTHVVNFAAESMVDRSIDDPGSFVLTDMYGAFVLLEEARRRGVRRFVHVVADRLQPANQEFPDSRVVVDNQNRAHRNTSTYSDVLRVWVPKSAARNVVAGIRGGSATSSSPTTDWRQRTSPPTCPDIPCRPS